MKCSYCGGDFVPECAYDWPPIMSCEDCYRLQVKEKDMEETLEQVIEALYISEINAQIQWCWDGGFDVSMGNTSVSGYGFAQNAAAEANFKTVAEVTEWLSETAKKLYPKSLFAIEREPATT